MGSLVEINDTLQITTEQGFPSDLLNLESHVKKTITIDDVKGKIFTFHGKPNARLFQLAPVRVYLVHNIAGKWLFWGKIAVIEQSISQKIEADLPWKEGQWETSGKFVFLDIYYPLYQEAFTKKEAPSGLSYFA